MNDDAIPRGFAEDLPEDQQDELCAAFFRIVAMEVSPPAHNALVSMMARGALRQQTATRFLKDLWRKPSKVKTLWQPRRVE